jgi:hypothetical protein
MPGRELAVREGYYDLRDNTSHDYIVRSAQWAWDLMDWYFQDREYATKHPNVYQIAYDAMVRNNQWAFQSLRIEAEEAVQRGFARGVIYSEEFAKISRFPEVEAELWDLIETTIERGITTFDPGKTYTDHDGEEWPLEDALIALRDLLQRFENAGLQVTYEGSHECRISSPDGDGYVYHDAEGIWEWSTK